MTQNQEVFTNLDPHPRFDLIKAEPSNAALLAVLKGAQEQLTELEAVKACDWGSLMEPLHELCAPVEYGWGLVHHYVAVMNSPQWRKVQEKLQPEVVAFSMRVRQSQALFDKMERLNNEKRGGALSDVRRRILEAALRDARLCGVALEGREKTEFNEIQRELADLSMRFNNNLLDATRTYGMMLGSRDEVEGLPDSLLAAAAEAAVAEGADGATAQNGPWRITLEFSSYDPFMKNSRRRDLRERLYRAYMTRASSGAQSNQEIINRILKLRKAKARLLGFENFAQISLLEKMAGTVAEAEGLMNELTQAAHTPAAREFDELNAYACAEDVALNKLMHWDIAYWSERRRESLFAFSDEMLRPYFPLEKVLNGLFDLCRRLFGIKIVSADGTVPVWHPDVRFFKVEDSDGEQLASFYLDPYSRPQTKRGGAWMSPAYTRQRRRDGRVMLPVAYLVCNQSRPIDGKPSLMTLREVETLFHEFGHGLQHMLTTVDEPGASGINNIEWDAVEVCSQFMENWCYHRGTVAEISGHYETGEPLPEKLFQQLCAARTFMAASAMVRQLYFSLLDLALHSGYDPEGAVTPELVQRDIAAKVLILQPLPEDRFLCGFSHIFGGGYAAGYYSYKWAEVLAADVFAAFEEVADKEPLAIPGRRLRKTFLALGGGKHPAEVFRLFRGRDPNKKALLRQLGLL